MWESLVKSRGWGRLVEILEEQVVLRSNTLLAGSIRGLDSAFEHTEQQGERRGIKLVLELPGTVIETLKEDIENATRELADE